MDIAKFSASTFKWILLLSLFAAFAQAQEENQQSDELESTANSVPPISPDVRGSDYKVKVEKGNFVAVPIPIFNPDLDFGLVLGAGYFYAQSEEQKKNQPASVTGVGAMYTKNESWAVGIGQASYWSEDKWRFRGALGLADMKLSLLSPDGSDTGSSLDWLLEGGILSSQLSRKIADHWYLGGVARYIDMEQSIAIGLQPLNPDISGDAKSVGLGVVLERDSRDMPMNAYTGSIFNVSSLFNNQSIGSENTYQSFDLEFKSYHQLSIPVVLAWQVKGCQKSGEFPVWDACRLGLRGFSATDYLGAKSALGQVEARWLLSDRWGLVGFAGAGYMANSYSGLRDEEAIPSYGVGLRFMVMKAQRINIRLDYGRSNDTDAWYLSVGEAF